MKKISESVGLYCFILSIMLIIAPLLLVVAFSIDRIVADIIDYVFRIFSGIMLVLGIILLVKVKIASKASKILIIIAGAIVIMFSAFLGFIAGFIGIIGSISLLNSSKSQEELED